MTPAQLASMRMGPGGLMNIPGPNGAAGGMMGPPVLPRGQQPGADAVNGIEVRQNIGIGVLIFEQERAKVGLPAFHHVLESADYCGIAHYDGFVKTRKQRPPCDR